MEITTPEGVLTIDDDVLTFVPADHGPVVTVPLDPIPSHDYQRGVYGTGGLSIGGAYIVLDNAQAEEVETELRRDRRPKKAKPSDSGTAS
jgi:hypothetical protein